MTRNGFHPPVKRTIIAISLLTLAQPWSHLSAADDWRLSGDVRGGYFSLDRTARNGVKSDDSHFRMRLRVAVDRTLSDDWRFRARAAGRYGDDQDRFSAYLRAYSPTPTGTEIGDTTLDELYLHYAPVDAAWSVRVGRFQGKFELPGVAAKGLARNDSTNVDVTWTDGAYLIVPVTDGWKGHLIVQYNHRKGTGTTARPPLDFSDSGSRAGVFAGLEAATNPGPVILRMIDVTWLPSSLATDGITEDRRQDYLATSGRMAAAWPVGKRGMRFVAGGEAGYAWRTPFGQVAGTGEAGRTDGFAWQIEASLYDIAPNHNFGAAYGRVGAGWLLSPDFRPNDELAEIRYQWRFHRQWSFEARLRRRKEIEIPDTAARARIDRDFYLRISGRF